MANILLIQKESYIADLKIQSDSVIEEIQVNCLLYSEHFTNNYQIEFTKDNKPLEQLQFRVGEFLLRPNYILFRRIYLR